MFQLLLITNKNIYFSNSANFLLSEEKLFITFFEQLNLKQIKRDFFCYFLTIILNKV